MEWARILATGTGAAKPAVGYVGRPLAMGPRKPATVPGRRRRRASSAAAGRIGGTGITAEKQRRCAARPGPGSKTVRRLITMAEETIRANDGRAL
jgi:hypothetical protein